MCQNSTEENKRLYESMTNKAKIAVSRALRVKAVETLKNCANGMFGIAKGFNIGSKEVEEGCCIIESDGRLCFSEKEIGILWRDYLKGIMSKKIIGIIMWKEMQQKVQ